MLEQKFKTDKELSLCTYNVSRSWISDYGNSGGFCSVTFTNPPEGEAKKAIDYFTNKGLIEIRKEVVYKDCAYWTENKVFVTNKGSEYIVKETKGTYEILTAKFDIAEVVGIVQEPDAINATVEYKVKKVDTTPFGTFWERSCYNEERIFTANFTKYDDGWRLN